MGSSLRFHTPSLVPSKCDPPLIRLSPLSFSRITKYRNFCTLVSSPRSNLEVSWIQTDGSSNDEFGGWFVRTKPETESNNGVPKLVLAGAGASMAVLLAALTYIALSKRGLNIQIGSPFESHHELLISSKSRKIPGEGANLTMLEVDQASLMKVAEKSETESDLSSLKVTHASASEESKHIVVPVPADPIQREALDVLKKLKIIEDDACAEELCTRREYARWFVKANSIFERNPKRKLIPMILTAGSTSTAFDDVSASDPDFWCIQALGEAGITASKLSPLNSRVSDISNNDEQGKVEFSPESFISRFDLVNWKAMLEYSFHSGGAEQMLRTDAALLDLRASSLGVPQLLMDLMAGDKSIVRRVFGNIRRLQPDKPVTKAQAAVALTSGRMAEMIKSEILRLEAEHQSRLAEMEEIRKELMRQGEIQRIWEERFNKEKEREFEVERDLQIALLELENERMTRNEGLAEYMKQKAALDYQQQLLSGLRNEVDEMCERLATQRADVLAEQQSLDDLLAELHNKQNAILEAKSMLEAEKEALRILRYWVEEEAWKIHVRVKNLEEAARRWKWNPDSGNPG